MMMHLLTIVLVILKALGYLAISWWIVFLPSIIAITFAVLLIAFGIHLFNKGN